MLINFFLFVIDKVWSLFLLSTISLVLMILGEKKNWCQNRIMLQYRDPNIIFPKYNNHWKYKKFLACRDWPIKKASRRDVVLQPYVEEFLEYPHITIFLFETWIVTINILNKNDFKIQTYDICYETSNLIFSLLPLVSSLGE